MKTHNRLPQFIRRIASRTPRIVPFAALAFFLLALQRLYRDLPTVPAVGVPTRPPVERTSSEPAIAISPESGSAGVYVQVVGEGWPTSSLVLIALRDERGRSGIMAASTADTEGKISTGFLYPISPRWLEDGDHTILAYTSDGRLEATALFRTGEAGDIVDLTDTAAVDGDSDRHSDRPKRKRRPSPRPSTVIPTSTPTPTATPHAHNHAGTNPHAAHHNRLARRILEQSEPGGPACS